MIVLTTKYPSQSQADAVNYPLGGKARNVTVSLDGTGTPLEKDWLNDLFGWEQALMAAAGLTPNGTVETQISSQLLQAIKTIVINRQIAVYQVTAGTGSGGPAAGSPFALTLVQQFGGYTLASNAIIVPAAGKYRVRFDGNMDSISAANPTAITAGIAVNGAVALGGNANVRRFSASTSLILSLSKEIVVTITTPGSQAISLQSVDANSEFSDPGLFMIDRLS